MSTATGSAPAIDLARIEHELRQLWQQNAADLAAGGQAVMRALTLNLVARARDPETADRVSEVLQLLTSSHPNRAVLAIVQPEPAEARLDAFVQANCLLAAPGVPQVCGEQITIDARGAAVAQVASLVLPLLVPDLPVALWLPGPAPFDDPLLARLRGVIDRLIVDTRDSDDPARDLARMSEFERSPDGRPGGRLGLPAVSDLSWAALTPWRELTAQFFDTRSLLPHLRRIDHVQIGIVPASGRVNLLPGLLMAGWLASCLGWSPLSEAVSVEGSTVRLYLRRPAVGVGPKAIRLVMIDLCPEGAPVGAAPDIAALRLRAVDGVQADFFVERVDEPGYARTRAQVAGLPTISRLAHCEELHTADLLAAELRLLSHDRTFASALRVAGIFAAQLP